MDPSGSGVAFGFQGLKQRKLPPSGWARGTDKRRFRRSLVSTPAVKDCERRIWGSAPPPQPLGLRDPQAGNAGARPAGKVEKSERQTVLRAVMDDDA